ncbi:cell death regulator Aven isoform 3-T3 [Lycaon pictus]
MQADRGASGGRGRRPGRARPGGDRDRERDRDRDRDRERAGAAAARGGGDSGGRRGRGRGFRGGRGGRGGGALRGGRREPGGRGAGARAPVEDDSDAETNGEENEEQGNYSKRKIVSNWDRYQDIEKEVNNESGESQRGTDFSVLLSSAGDSFSQFRFVEEKEWDGEVSGPKQTALPLELPQMKPKRNDEAKGLGMQLKGPLGPGGKGSVSELKPAACCPAPSGGPQKPTAPLPSAADHLEEELDLLLSLDAPVREGESILSDLTPGLESEKDRDMAQEGQGPAEPSVTDEKNVQSEQPSTSKPVTEEELEDWLDSMIS